MLYYVYLANNTLIRVVLGSFLGLGSRLLVGYVCVWGTLAWVCYN
jgi:hypothetical protein